MSNERVQKASLALLTMQRHSWEQGVALDAFMALGESETAILLAKEAAYRRIADGRVAEIGWTSASTDPCSLGEGLLYAYEKTGDMKLKKAYEDLLLWALEKAPRSDKGIVYHFTDKEVFWVDSMYMLPPFLAVAGHYDESFLQIQGYLEKLYDDKKGLMFHQWNQGNQCFDRKLFWGTGNGWAIAGLARVIDALPNSYSKKREELIRLTLKMIEAISHCVREDGLTHDILDDERTFVDTCFPMMLSYTIYRGVRKGWIPETWMELANRCRQGANNKVDEYGLVQDACGAPHFDSPGVSPESQAFYLLMEAEASIAHSI